MILRIGTAAFLAGAVLLAACGGKDSNKDRKEAQKEGVGPDVSDTFISDESLPGVVAETGTQAPIARPQPAVEGSLVFGKAPCKSNLCFSLGEWSLSFGQTYIQRLVGGTVSTQIVDGFDTPLLSSLQAICLAETANALREYASDNPTEMKDFAVAGVNTSFAARVYDTTNNKNKVRPSLYFIKGSDGKEAGASLSRGKWILRSAITGDKERDDCEILSPAEIKKGISFWRGELLRN